MSDIVFIQGLNIDTVIGVYAWERVINKGSSSMRRWSVI